MLWPQAQAGRISRIAVLAAALLSAIALAYARVRHAGFIWDDEQHLTQNPVIVGPLSFAAAITSKPSTVILPAVLALYLWWREGSFRWRNLRALVPFLFISLVASAWTVWEQKYHAHAIGAEWLQSPLQRILISADAIWFYLLKLIWPHPLIFIYPRWSVDPSRPLVFVPLVTLAIIAIFLRVARNGLLRPVFFALAYFVIAL